jgi:predicted nucleotidyltransferase
MVTDLATVLFGRTRQAVLALMFGHPEESFHVRRIARFAGTGMGALVRELSQLEGCGILRRTVAGRQVFYQADPACPIFHELRGLVTKTAGVSDVLRHALLGLGDAVELAFVFGSLAKGTARAASDVDVLVVGSATIDAIVDALAPAQDCIGREINPMVFPPLELREKVRAGHPFLSRVLAGPKSYLVGNDHELARLAE